MPDDRQKHLPDDQRVFSVSMDVYTGQHQNLTSDDAFLFAALEEIWRKETAHLAPSGYSYTESWEAVPYSIVAEVDLTALAASLKWDRKHLVDIFAHLEENGVASIMLNR